uniref:F-box protein 39 n=1 Tax=Kryptolebias marmoratus TaxID=37003 RepID=A0A3Q3EEU7_KRYMA
METPEFSGWDTLPDVALLHIFKRLSDADRSRAARVCHHWYRIMRSPCLWRTRCFRFNGRLSKYKQSDYGSAVGYIHSLGVYLERLEVTVCPPRSTVLAQRLHDTIWGMFKELSVCLHSVRVPLTSLSLVRLELDRSGWTRGYRRSVVNILINFLTRGASKLNYLCLNGMRNDTQQGRDVLLALVKYQRALSPHSSLSSLDLRDFFSTHLPVQFNSRLPRILQKLQGLTYLGLSYSCLSDELIMSLCQCHRGKGWTSGRGGKILHLAPFSLSKLVCGHSWATLVSSYPDLKVHISVDQVINTDSLAKILLPEIPLRKFSMTGFYSPDENWSIKPLLCHMLPRYRHSLQYLTLDVSNCVESVDEELLELVAVCERLEDLRVWAFMDVQTVGSLLHMRLTQRFSLNKIKVRKQTKQQHLILDRLQGGRTGKIFVKKVKYFEISFPE